jgi:hypothetical protein
MLMMPKFYGEDLSCLLRNGGMGKTKSSKNGTKNHREDEECAWRLSQIGEMMCREMI